MSDLFGNTASNDSYDASNIEVLEGLEPFGDARGCMLAAPTSAPCIIWRLKFWIMRWIGRRRHANRIDILESATH